MIEKVPLTADIPAVRAAFKERPEDFVVDEVAAGAPPPGEGYAWVRIEKRGIATDEAIRRIAGRLGRDEHAIGYAGRKDAQGITRQWLSIAGAADPEALRAAIDDADVRLLEAVPAGRKIKLGELAGNRFVLRLRGVSEIDERRAREVLARLRLLGAPASFGAQRFGIRGNSHEIGRAILLGRSRDALDLLLGRPAEAEGPRLRAARAAYERGDLAAALREFPRAFVPERRALEALLCGEPADRALAAVPFRTRELYLSAYQAALFNRVLADRIRAGTLGTLEPGDLAIVHATGETMEVADPAALALRARRLEVSPTGPLFGHAAPRPRFEVGARELRLLVSEGLSHESWARPEGLALRGARRPLRFPIEELRAERSGPDLLVAFRLPPGAYATAIVDEILKT